MGKTAGGMVIEEGKIGDMKGMGGDVRDVKGVV